jgi:hypothetical protein
MIEELHLSVLFAGSRLWNVSLRPIQSRGERGRGGAPHPPPSSVPAQSCKNIPDGLVACLDHKHMKTPICFVFLYVFVVFGPGACMIAAAPPPSAAAPASIPPSAASPSAPAGERYQENTWLPGGDLRTFDLAQGGPEACASACQNEPECYAYSYVKPEHASRGVGECALKHNVPLASKSECCVSGVIRPWR